MEEEAACSLRKPGIFSYTIVPSAKEGILVRESTSSDCLLTFFLFEYIYMKNRMILLWILPWFKKILLAFIKLSQTGFGVFNDFYCLSEPARSCSHQNTFVKVLSVSVPLRQVAWCLRSSPFQLIELSKCRSALPKWSILGFSPKAMCWCERVLLRRMDFWHGHACWLWKAKYAGCCTTEFVLYPRP